MQVIFLLAWGGGNLSDMQDLLEFYRDSVYQCSTLTLYSELIEKHKGPLQAFKSESESNLILACNETFRIWPFHSCGKRPCESSSNLRLLLKHGP